MTIEAIIARVLVQAHSSQIKSRNDSKRNSNMTKPIPTRPKNIITASDLFMIRK